MESQSFFHGSNVGRCFLNELFVFSSKSVLFFLLEGWKDACASCENNSKSTRNRELPRIRPSTKTNKKRRLPELLKKGKPWLVNWISFDESTFLKGFAGITFELVWWPNFCRLCLLKMCRLGWKHHGPYHPWDWYISLQLVGFYVKCG